MTLRLLAASLLLPLALSAAPPDTKAPAKPEEKKPFQALIKAGEAKWKDAPPSLPKGARIAVLEGDMAKPEYFAALVELPPGYRLPPHSHPAQERVTVLAGTYMWGQGERFDEKALEPYPMGSYLSTPPGKPHFARVNQTTLLLITTIGPWGIEYLDPEQDPAKKKAE